MARFADHFSGHAEQYAAFRPTYPTELGAYLAGLCAARSMAWDCATGNGQAAVMLAEHFDRVVATDASRTQLAHARSHPGVRYAVALADQSGLADHCVDLVSVAQALHWFDLDRFFAEVRRVLAPGGVFAAWCYGLIQVDPGIDLVLQWFYSERVGRYWPPERRHVDAGYQDLPFPFAEIEAGAWRMTAHLTVGALLDYIGTWSAVVKARRAEASDPLAELASALSAQWTPEDQPRAVVWPIALRAGRVDTTAP